MRIEHLLEDDEGKKKESGPSGFDTLRDLGNKTFKRYRIKVAAKGSDYSVLDPISYEVNDDEENSKLKALGQFNDFYGLELSPREVKFTVEKLDTGTAPQQINDYMSKLKQSIGTVEQISKSKGAITLGNIRRVIKSDIGDDYRTPVLTTILGEFIDNPGSKNFPVTVINDTRQMIEEYDFDSTADIINDFAEVLAPVGLLTDNLNGNGQRLVADFLGAKTFDELASGATMHFQPDRTFPLVDSYIEYNGRVVSISSKSNGGAAASFAGFYNSLKEIDENPTSKRMFAELLANPRFFQAYEVLKVIIDTDDGDDTDLTEAKQSTAKIEKQGTKVKMSAGVVSMEKYINRSYNLIKLLKKTAIGKSALQNIDITPNDVKLMTQFIQDQNIQKIGDWTNKSSSFKQLFNEFSPGFKHLFIYYRAPGNAMGRAFQSGNELTDVKTKKSMWTAFKQGCAFHINRALNSDQAYSDLATWIFNHGAIIQVNFVTSKGYNWSSKSKDYDFRGNGYLTQANDDAQPLVFYNMIATWPATGVDAVTFEWGASEDKITNRMNADGHDTLFPVKDSELATAINQEDPVASAMIARLDKRDPDYDEKVTNIYMDVAEKRRTQERDIAKTPDKWAQMGVSKSGKLKSAIGRGVNGSSPANFFVSKFEAYRAASTGLTDGEIKKKYSSDLQSGAEPERLSNFIDEVRSARKDILTYVLYRTTDKKVAEKYNKLISNDLLGSDNPHKTVKFNEAEDYSTIYPKTATQRQAYTNLLDPNASDRTDTIIIAGIRNFERIRQQQPNRFAQLLKDAGISNQSGSIDRPTISKLDARSRLNDILKDRRVATEFNKIPREEHSHVYGELIDMMSIGATEDEIKSEIKNWRQNELATVGGAPATGQAQVVQPRQSPAVQQPARQSSANGQSRYTNVYNSLRNNPEFIRLWTSLGDKQSFIEDMIELFNETSFVSLNSDVTEFMSQLRDMLGVRESRSHILRGILG